MPPTQFQGLVNVPCVYAYSRNNTQKNYNYTCPQRKYRLLESAGRLGENVCDEHIAHTWLFSCRHTVALCASRCSHQVPTFVLPCMVPTMDSRSHRSWLGRACPADQAAHYGGGARRRRALARRRRAPTGSDQSHEDDANRGVTWNATMQIGECHGMKATADSKFKGTGTHQDGSFAT